jgi:hypothetical protein
MRSLELFGMIYEDPIISKKLIDESVLFLIYEIITFENLLQIDNDLFEFILLIFKSRTTHSIFNNLTFDERFILIE